MSLDQKKHYLESYKRAREKYETLKSSLESVHSASYFNCNSRNNKPSNILYCKYVCLMSDEEIANDNDMSTKEMKKWIDRRIRKLNIV